MPIKPPNAPDYYCDSCGHPFRQPLWRRLLRLQAPAFAICPRCSHLVVRLQY